MGNTNNRTFSYNRGVRYKGNTYPSSDALLVDNNGQQRQGLIFADNDSNYYTLLNGAPMPVTPMHTLDEVTVTAPKKHKRLSDAFGDYLTQSNDITMVNNLPHGEYNTHLKDNAINGAKSHAIWEQEHPNLAAWSNAAASVPFAVAAAPFVLGAGEAVAGTALGQGITNGLGIVANAASNNTWLPWIDAGVTSIFGAKGLQDMANGKFTPETAMEVMPLMQLGKPMYEAGKGAYDVGKELYDTGALWDKYTTFQGRFGNYGDNLLTNMYGTYARRLGLPDKARLPADAIRKLRQEVSIDSDGMVNFTGHKGFAGNPHINTTLDRPVVSHDPKGKADWDGADTYLFPVKDLIDQTKGGSLKSIEPSDAFANGAGISISPDKVTVISGDVNTLERAKAAGMQTLSSPRLRRMYARENNNYQNAVSNANSFMKRTIKPPKKELGLPYATEIQRLQSMRGTPTLADFRLLEQQTGLDAGVAPIGEYQNAINSLNSMLNPSIQDIMNGTVKPYVYPNGREVDFTTDHIKKELELIQKAKYNNVFYDPATWAEFNWKKRLGLE